MGCRYHGFRFQLKGGIKIARRRIFKPEGNFAAILTPFEKWGGINEATLRKIIDFQIEKGVDGLYPGGSSGEFVHLSLKQRLHLMEIVLSQARGRVPVVPGATASCTADCIMLAKHAQKIGCDAVVIGPPYYYPVSQEMMEQHYLLIADSIEIPIILDNNPSYSSFLSPDLVERLCGRGNFVAVKDSSGDMVQLVHLIDRLRMLGSACSVLVGREEIYFPGLMVGCTGGMFTSSGIIPEVFVSIYQSWQEGNLLRAKDLQFVILQFMRISESISFPVGFKIAMETRGFVMGPLKQPLPDLDKYNYLRVKAQLETFLHSLLKGTYGAKVDDETVNNTEKLFAGPALGLGDNQ